MINLSAGTESSTTDTSIGPQPVTVLPRTYAHAFIKKDVASTANRRPCAAIRVCAFIGVCLIELCY